MMIFITLSKQGQILETHYSDLDKQQLISAYNNAIWVEVLNPTPEEREFMKEIDNIDLVEHHELHQIEFSNQFYHEGDNICLTTNLVTVSYPFPESHALNIVVTKEKIITVRYSNPNPVELFLKQMSAKPTVVKSHYDLLKMLIQFFIGKNADIFEVVGERTNYLALDLSKNLGAEGIKKRQIGLSKTLEEVNLLEGLSSMAYQSLSSLAMLLNYLEQSLSEDLVELKNLNQDISALRKHGDYLNQKIVFQLNSTLGMINIEQMAIVKIFTVLALVFMPPTLISSIYGMNFKHMPELEPTFAYPVALAAILLSSYVPWQFFRKKGWI